MKNKRADVSITILVIGVFAICALAIVSFVVFNQKIQNNFASVDTVENLSYNLDLFYFYVNSGLSYQDAANMVGGQLQGNQLTLNAIQRQSQGLIPSNNQPIILSVKYVVDLSK